MTVERARKRLKPYGLRYEGVRNLYSAVVEDGRRVYADGILELHETIFGYK